MVHSCTSALLPFPHAPVCTTRLAADTLTTRCPCPPPLCATLIRGQVYAMARMCDEEWEQDNSPEDTLMAGSARRRLLGYVDSFQLSLGGEEGGDGDELPDASSTSTRRRRRDVVNLMTVHASKGLEYDCVVITGLEESSLPSKGTLQQVSWHDAREGRPPLPTAWRSATPDTDTDADVDASPAVVSLVDARAGQVDEERRVLYVGMTRARKQLILTYRQKNVVGLKHIPLKPSRFLGDLPEGVQFVRATGR